MWLHRQGCGSIPLLAAFSLVVAVHVEESHTGASSRNQADHGLHAADSDGPLSFLTTWLLRRLEAAEAKDILPAAESKDHVQSHAVRGNASLSQAPLLQLQDAGIQKEWRAVADYEFVNSFLKEQVFLLGDQGPFSNGWGQEVYIRNLTCTDVTVKDMSLISKLSEEKTMVHVDLSVAHVFLHCTAGLEITVFGATKHGSFKAISSHKSGAGARLTFSTARGEDFTRYPPSSVTYSACDSRTSFVFNDVELYDVAWGATTTLGPTVARRLGQGFKDKVCDNYLPNLHHKVIDILTRPLFHGKPPEYSSMQQDDDVAERLAGQSHTHALDMHNDGLIGLVSQGLHALPLGRMASVAIADRVPSPLVLAGEDTLLNASGQGIQASLALKNVALQGVDSVRDITLFKRTSKSSAVHSVSWDQIDLHVELAVSVSSPKGDMVFPANVTVGVQGVTIDLQTMLALDKHTWQTTAFGSVWHSIQNGVPAACWVKAILAADLADLNITFDSFITSEVNAPVGDSGLPSGFGYVLQQLSSVGLELFGGFVEDNLAPVTFQTSVREVMNGRLKSFLQGSQGQVCPPFHYKRAPAVNYSTSPFSDLSMRVNELFHPNSKARHLVRELTQQYGYSLGQVELIDGNGLQLDITQNELLPYLFFHLNASNVRVVNLDQVYDIWFLDPRGAYNLYSSAGVHQPGIEGHITASLYSQRRDPNTGHLKSSKAFKADASISLSVTDVMLILNLFMPFDLHKLLNLTLSRVSFPCFVGAFEDLAIRLFNLTISGIALDIQCKKQKGSCSKEVLDIARRAHNRTVTSQATEQINNFIRQTAKLFETVTAGENLYKVVQRSHNLCWDLPEDPSLAWIDPSAEANAASSFHSMLVLFVGWLFPMLWIGMLAGLALAFMWLHRKVNVSQDMKMGREDSMGSSGSGSSTTVSGRFRMKQAWRNVRRSSAPFLCACVFNIFLFIVAHFHIGAQVDFVVNFMGVEARYPSWKSFNVIQTVKELWRAKAYLLSVLIAVFSIIWPYVKLCSLIAMILLPPEIQNYRHREKLLFIMDRLGKYSLLDVYFIVLVFGFLQVEVGTPRRSLLLGPDFLLVNIEVMPCLGLIALIVGVIMSICLNQIALSMHRRTVEVKEGKLPGELIGGEKEALCNHNWLVHMGMPFHQQMRPSGKVCMALSMVLTIVLISVGWCMHFVDTDIHGVAGFFKKMRGDPPHSPHSLVSFATANFKQGLTARAWDHCLGVYLIMVCQILFAGLFPLLQVVCMLVLWLKPMTIRSHRRMNLFIQALSAVASLEVFLFSCCVGYVEITHLTETMGLSDMNQGLIAPLLEMATQWGIINRAFFLSLQISFRLGFNVLAWGATLYCMLSSKMIEWSVNAERERLIEYRRQHGVIKSWSGVDKDSSLSASRSYSINLQSEFQAKVQYASAWMRLMAITDVHNNEAREKFWERCHQGGLDTFEAPGMFSKQQFVGSLGSLNSSTAGSASSLVEPLLRTEAEADACNP